jgi:hypothetical protein
LTQARNDKEGLIQEKEEKKTKGAYI